MLIQQEQYLEKKEDNQSKLDNNQTNEEIKSQNGKE